MPDWSDGAPPDMGDQEMIWIVAEIPAWFGSNLVRYETCVWHQRTGWSKGAHRAQRWMILPLPNTRIQEGEKL